MSCTDSVVVGCGFGKCCAVASDTISEPGTALTIGNCCWLLLVSGFKIGRKESESKFSSSNVFFGVSLNSSKPIFGISFPMTLPALTSSSLEISFSLMIVGKLGKGETGLSSVDEIRSISPELGFLNLSLRVGLLNSFPLFLIFIELVFDLTDLLPLAFSALSRSNANFNLFVGKVKNF